MSEDQTTIETNELDELKQRATQLGIQFHPSIGVDKLREKVNEALQPAAAEEDHVPLSGQKETESRQEFIKRLQREASELVRVRVTNMNPNTREYSGDIFCAGNRFVGTHKKYVHFDTEWHVPRIIYHALEDRMCQIFVNRVDDRGRRIREGKQIKEFNVQVLPPLTEDELKALAQRQAMANGTSAA